MKKNLITFEVFKESVNSWYPYINVNNELLMLSLFNHILNLDTKTFCKYNCKFPFIHKSIISKKFYIERGWSEEEAISFVYKLQQARSSYSILETKGHNIKAKSDKRKDDYNKSKHRLIEKGTYADVCKSKGNSSKWEFYLDKINPATNKKYTEEEAKLKINKKQRKFLDKMWNLKRLDDSLYINDTDIRYWLNKGYSKEAAADKIKERQHTFSLTKCIEKYGEIEGLKKFNERQKKWQMTMNSKSAEEKFEIYSKKLKNFKRYSKISVKLFEKVINLLNDDGIFIKAYYAGNEHFLRDYDHNTIKYYDLYFPDIKLLVEYHGSVFHPSLELNDVELKNWKCPISKVDGLNKRMQDNHKLELAKKHNLDILVLWEKDSNLEQILLEYIKEKINKQQ